MNILFSSTKQWNPGDEFILDGVRAILRELGISYNSLLYNRNPDVKPQFSQLSLFNRCHLPLDFWREHIGQMVSANLRFGVFDNSVKPQFDYSCVDWVIIAGTPEWCNSKMIDLYQSLIQNNVPLIILGVGGGCDIRDPRIEHSIRKAKLLTVRESDTLTQAAQTGLTAQMLPCPALLCAVSDREREISEVNHIGLVYQASRAETVIWNGCDPETYDYLVKALRSIVMDPQFCDIKFSIVCHYVDEVPLAMRDFPNLEVRYSHDSGDYYEIYKDFDALVGSRVHGIGIGASLGVPGVAIVHDQRGPTCAHFLADIVMVGFPVDQLVKKVAAMVAQVSERNKNLLAHKQQTMDRYVVLMRSAMDDPHVEYDTQLLHSESPPITLEDLGPLVAELDRLQAPDRKHGADAADLIGEILARLYHIEVKLDQLV